MKEEKARNCASCGAPLKEGASFCTRCGVAVSADAVAPPTAAVEQPPPPPQAGTVGGGAPPPPQAGFEGAAAGVPASPAAPAPRRGKALLAAGIFGGVLALGAAAFLVLYLALWRDGGGGGKTSDHVALAQKCMDALEAGDFDAYMDCMDPELYSGERLEELEGYGFELDMEDVKELAKELFGMVEYEFEGVKLEEKSRSGENAKVVTTAGTMRFSAFGVDQEVDLAEDPLEFEMVRKDGRWYIAEDPFGSALGGGVDVDFEDLDFEEMEEMLPEDMRDFMEDFERMFEEDWVPEEEGTT